MNSVGHAFLSCPKQLATTTKFTPIFRIIKFMKNECLPNGFVSSARDGIFNLTRECDNNGIILVADFPVKFSFRCPYRSSSKRFGQLEI